MTATAAVVVLTSVATEADGIELIRQLVERRLIACGTVLAGARSIYRWQGAVADEREAVVLLKTVMERIPDLRAAFAQWHRYEVPELLALPVAAGSDAYLAWVDAETRPQRP